jgi:DNA replication protein DnaC
MTANTENTPELAIPEYLHRIQIPLLEEKRRDLLATFAAGGTVETFTNQRWIQQRLTPALLAERWAKEAKDAEERQTDFVDLKIPLLYRTASAERARDRDAFRRVMEYAPGSDADAPPGVVAFGGTGTGKSSALYARLVADYFVADSAVTHISAVHLAELVRELSLHNYSQLMQIVRLLRGGFPSDEEEGGELERRYFGCDGLLIDDIHVPKLTPAYAQVLYSIIEARTAKKSPLYISCQMTGDDLLRKLAGDDPDLRPTAEAIVRRIAEFCHPVEFRRP